MVGCSKIGAFTLRTKIPIIATIVLWLLLLLFVSFLRYEFSHTYSHWIEGLDLPALTQALSAPVLGLPEPLGAAATCASWVFWSLLWLAPIALGVAVVRAPDEEAALRTWVSWAPLYAVFVTLAFLVVAVGLWLPFALL